MKSSPPKTAEANFREAFERLKIGVPKVLALGSHVSQNNVAKEAGCDPSALRKSRFPSLVAEIQNYLANHGPARPESKRQALLKQRQRSRTAKETISDLKKQRDKASGLLTEAEAQIGLLTRKLKDMEARLENLHAQAKVIPMGSSRPKSTPRAMDIISSK